MTIIGNKFLIIQYDNREINTNTNILININKNYCNSNNYHYIFINKNYNLPPYWIKVKLVRDYLISNNYKGVMWLDTDAVIYNDKIKLEDIINKNKSFYMSPDNKRWNSPFNAGVFIVLNNDKGKNIMNDWLNLYNQQKWNYINNKWYTTGKWAGETYEQGSFVNNLLKKYNSDINVFEWFFFNATYSNIPEYKQNIFTLHFAGVFKYEIPKYIKEYILVFILVKSLFYTFAHEYQL
jgi:hypothetical protein